MKRNVLAVALLVVAVVASVFVVLVSTGAPPQPYNYNGFAWEADGSTPVGLGIRITTFIDGVDYSNGTAVYDGLGHYDVDVYGNWWTNLGLPNTPNVKEGGDLGDGVMFVKGDMTGSAAVFTAQGTWASLGVGQTENRDLTLAANPPGLVKIARITTQPADLGTQYLYLCNRGTTQVDLTQYSVQKDGTGAPTNYLGPRQILTAGNTVPTMLSPGGLAYVNLINWDVGGTTLATTGDALKLVWDNPGGLGGFGGQDIVVDRVEYNQTGGGGGLGLIGEPSNTTMSDARAPGLGQEIRRTSPACGDTNDNWADFSIAPETGRTTNPPPTVTVDAPIATDDWTGGTTHTIRWTMNDDVAGDLDYTVDADLDGSLLYLRALGAGRGPQGANSLLWNPVDLVDTTLVTIRVIAVDAGGQSAYAFSPRFKIDSTKPVLSATSPGEGQTGVDPNGNVQLTFSEAMNQAATNAAISINPGNLPHTTTWDGPGRIATVDPTPVLAGNTRYTVTVACGARDVSDTGNLLANCPRTLNFTTAITNVTPIPAISRPVGGEVWSGGQPQAIQFTVTDGDSASVNVWMNISIGGGPYAVLAGQTWPVSVPADGSARSLAVTIPNTNTANAVINLTAVDPTFMRGWVISAAFSIDAFAPTVLTVDPAGGDTSVPIGKLVTITFSEAMNQGATFLAFTSLPGPAPNPGGWGPGNGNWVSPSQVQLSHLDFTLCQQYTMTINTGAKDLSDSGNGLPAAYVWSFTTICAPTVTVSAPVATDVWTGGVTHTLGFTIADADSPTVHVWANLSIDGGASYPTNLLDAPSVPRGVAQTPSVTIPLANTTTAVIKVTAQDPTRLEGSGVSATFAIDSAAPTVTASSPAEGATGQSQTTPFTITFSEPMDHTATEGAISLTPSAGTLSFSWSGNTVTVTHANGLLAATNYTLAIGAAAKDVSDTGNYLAPVSIHFRSAGTTLTASIAGPATGNVGDTLTYTCTCTGTITQYRWRFTDPNLVIHFVNTTTATVQYLFDTAGTWGVSLTVTDGVTTAAASSLTVTISAKQLDFLSQYWWVLLIILIAVIAAILFLLLGRRRKKEEPEAVPPEDVETVPPAKPGAPPKKAAPATGAAAAAGTKAAPKAGTKECPSCGSILEAKDTECFMCGAKV